MFTIRSVLVLALLFGLSACGGESEPQAQTAGAGQETAGALEESATATESAEDAIEESATATESAEDVTESLDATLASKFTAGSCCDKAVKADKACGHGCCVKAAKAGEVCTSCNSG